MTDTRLLLVGDDAAAVRALASLARERGAQVTHAAGVALLDEESLERAFEQAGDGPSAVVHALSLPAARSRVGEWGLDAWERHVLAVLRSAFMVARRSVEDFLAGGEGGRLIFLVDAEGAEGDAAREIVRGGLLALVRSVAKEYGPRRIGCNALLGAGAAARDPRRIAETAWTLLTAEGAYVTGEVIDLGPAGAPRTR